jgi:uncharacterized protein (DUF2336 family)
MTTHSTGTTNHAGRVLGDTLESLSARVRLGSNPAAPDSALTALAHDQSVTVRAAVALNSGTSPAADQLLAADPDARIRMLIAQKVLAQLPDMPAADRRHISEQTAAVLSILVRDEALRIRIMVADVLAGHPDVPRDLILTLAHDTAVQVSEPVLRLSPLLSADELLSLLADPPHAAAGQAIARRTDLHASVADMIVAVADSASIRALLINPSASIRESTLDTLIARAHDHPEWHEPLVRRPSLPPHAARALSEFVASHWLQVLADRTDLPAALKSELKQRLWARLAGEHPADSSIADEVMINAALRLKANGQLDEAALMDAAHAGDSRRAAALLAVAAEVPLAAVDRAATMRSAKALVSLVWKAGFTMRVAAPIQSLLGRLGPAGVLLPRDRGFPLSADEMGWQLDVLARAGRETDTLRTKD